MENSQIPLLKLSDKMANDWYLCERCNGEFRTYNRFCPCCNGEKRMQYKLAGDVSDEERSVIVDVLSKYGY
jgi:predicted amidophosphoribosyltransferase